jgi:hypothetical protein
LSLLRPALTRSHMTALSNSAKAEIMVNIILPAGVVVSTFSL